MNRFSLILVILMVSTASISAQSESIPAQIESLNKKKADLLSQSKKLKNKIADLEVHLSEKDAELKDCNEALFRVKYGDDVAGRVSAGRVWKGMNEEMLKASWGKPDKVETNREKWGVFSQWYYGDIVYFFRDGKLIEWEDGYDKKKLDKEKGKK